MKVKYIQKMQKWNAKELTPKQLAKGLKRVKFIVKRDGLYRISKHRKFKKFHCMLFIQKEKPYRATVIARMGNTKDQAIAKCGLAAPIKAWSMK